MRIVLLQRDLDWGNPESNLVRLDQALSSNAGADLYVLPEMFTTGFATMKSAVVEEEPCRSLAWMKQKAAAMDAAFAGSVALQVGDECRNRFYFVKPDGSVTVYDKHHLFTYGGEKERFSAGGSRVSVEWRGVVFRLAVCYDLRFPIWLRNDEGYDALICVANWPQPRRDNWDVLLRARAVENQCYVIGVNRVGDDPVCHYNGGTAFIDPYGNVVASCPDNTECECTGTIEKELLEEFRAKFPVLDDADKFEIR